MHMPRREMREKIMPVISMFYGVIIRMFFKDNQKHHTPHIHAEYQGSVAVIGIPDGHVLDGSLPQNKLKIVVAWIEIHQEELLADWQMAVEGKSVFKIRGLE